MAFLKQVLATVVLLALAGAGWIYFDPAPGRYLLAEDSPLPTPLRPLVASLSSADDPAPVGATQRDTRDDALPLVVVDPAVPDVTRDRLRAIGTAQAVRSVEVYPEVAGIVTEVHFDPGDRVSQGDVLATLENADQRLALDRAQIALAAAEAQLERYEALASSSSITAVQVEEVQRTAQTAQLDVRAAQIALERRSILSPNDGRVGLTPVQPGALVGTQTLITTVDDRSRLKVVFSAPEAFLAGLSIGHPVEATPTTRTGQVYQGEIVALDSRIDEASRTLRTEALIENPSDDLRPGMSFSVEISFPGEEFLSVDPLAIQWERAGSYVWVVRDERVAKAPLRIIERNIERVLVASDELRPDDLVVTEGVHQLREGVEVRLREEPNLPPLPDTPDEESVPSAAGDGPAVLRPANAAERSEDSSLADPAAERRLASRRANAPETAP